MNLDLATKKPKNINDADSWYNCIYYSEIYSVQLISQYISILLDSLGALLSTNRISLSPGVSYNYWFGPSTTFGFISSFFYSFNIFYERIF